MIATSTGSEPIAPVYDGTSEQNSQEKQDELDLPFAATYDLIQRPFSRPLDTVCPPPPPELSPDQQLKYDMVLKTVSAWVTVPTTSAKNSPEEHITDDECMFLSRECLLRYLRATKWDINEASARLKGTLTWRREYGIRMLTPDFISIENETGKDVLLGYDIHGRPCLYMMPKNQNTEVSDRQMQHLVFMLERTIDLMGPDQETLAIVINFDETKSGQGGTIGQVKQTLNILQYHYPERLGRAFVINIPFVMWCFLKLASPFIDPQTRQKLVFNEDLRKHVPPEQLMKSVGGEVEFKYNHSIYWPALNQLTEQRRKEYRERWIDGGKRIGEYENFLKGGTSLSLLRRQTGSNDLGEKMNNLALDTSQTEVPGSMESFSA